MENKDFILYVRNFIFGTEDSLVSTVSLLAGIVSAGVSRREVIVTGLVLIFVEAFSMSVGSFLSERTTEEFYPEFEQKNSKSISAAIIMFFSYLLCGLIPLSPYMLLEGTSAFTWSIIASLVALLLLGFTSAKMLRINIFKSALRMAIMGGIAICLGVIVGIVIK